jgi:hypothetical protein
MLDNLNEANTKKRRSSFRSILKGILIFVIFVLFLLVGAVFFIRTGLDGDTAVKLVIPKLERALGTRITYSSAQLLWLSSSRIRVSIIGMDFQEKGAGRYGLRIPKTVVDVRLPPLLKRKILLERVELTKPSLAIAIDGDGAVFRRQKKKRDGKGGGIAARLTAHDLIIHSASVQLHTKGAKRDTFQRVLRDIEIEARDLSPDRIESLRMTGLAVNPGPPGFLKINYRSGTGRKTPRHAIQAVIAGCPTQTLGALSGLWGYHIPVANGKADVTLSLTESQGKLRAKGEARLSDIRITPGRYFHQEAVVDKAGLKFDASYFKDVLHVDMRGISLPGLNMRAGAVIKEWSGENPVATLYVKAASLQLEKVYPYTPLNLLKSSDQEKLLKAGLKGRLTVSNGSWSGPISDLLAGNIIPGVTSLNVFMESVSGFIPGLKLPIRDASGKLSVTAEEVRFERVDLKLASSPIVLNGSIRNLSVTPFIDLYIALEGKAEDLRPLLSYGFMKRRISSKLGWLEEPKGRVELKLNIKGYSNNLRMKGKAALKNLDCKIQGMPLPIKDFNGLLSFRGPRIAIKELSGSVGNTSVKVSGQAINGVVNLTVSADVSPKDLKELKLLPEGMHINGTCPLRLTLEGKPPNLAYDAHVDLINNPLSMSWYVKKKRGVPLAIGASGAWNSGSVSIENGYIKLKKRVITVTGAVDPAGGSDVTIHLPKNGIQTAELIPLIHPWLELQPGGRVEGGLRVRTDPERSSPYVEANFNLGHISAQLLNFYKPSTGLTGSIEWKGPLFRLKMETMRIGASQFSGALTIRGLKSPDIQLTLSSSFFDYTDFVSPPDAMDQSTWGEWIRTNSFVRFLARGHGKAVLKAKKLKTQSRALSNFQAVILAKGGLLKIPEWSMRLADGNVTGTGLIDFRKRASTPFQLKFQGDRLKLEQLFGPDTEGLQIIGHTLCDGRMEWRLTESRENNGIYKIGSIDMLAGKGTIYRFEILSKIFSLINFGSILRGRFPNIISEGLPFRKLRWRMDVLGNQWRVRNLEMDSDAASITASGIYIDDKDEVDFTVTVAPLVGLDMLLSGLFGDLLTKDGKSVTATFQVRGPTGSPEVRLTPLDGKRVR